MKGAFVLTLGASLVVLSLSSCSSATDSGSGSGEAARSSELEREMMNETIRAQGLDYAEY